MSMITLTSDWGSSEHYAALVKIKLASMLPATQVMDITHQIKSHDTTEASKIIMQVAPYCPPGTIHFIEINQSNCDQILVVSNNQYYLGANNGVLSGIGQLDNVQVYLISKASDTSIFPALDLYCDIAAAIIAQKPLENITLGPATLLSRIPFIPIEEANSLRFIIDSTDSYGNLITNLTKAQFESAQKGRAMTLSFGRKYKIDSISNSYASVGEGEAVAIFNSAGLLEIAMYLGRANQLLGLNKGDTIRIDFNDN